MISLTNEKINHIESKTFVIYAKKNLVLMIKNITKSEIIVILLLNIKVLLIIFVI